MSASNGVNVGASVRDSSQYFNGLMDDFRIYSSGLSDEDIADLANGQEISGDYVLGSALDVNGDLTIEGSLSTSSQDYAIALSGSLINKSDQNTFTPNSSTITLNGGDQTLSGSITLYNLTKQVTSAQTLILEVPSTITVTNSLTLNGTAGNLLSVQSATAGTRSNLTLSSGASSTLSYLDVLDIDAGGGDALACSTSTNSENNVNVTFGGSLSIAGTAYTDSGSTAIGSSKTVAVEFENGSKYIAETNSSGEYSVANITYSIGDHATVFLEDETENAVTDILVGSTSITGIDLYQDHLIVRSESGTTPISASILGESSSDTDVTAILTSASASGVSIPGATFMVWTGEEYGTGGTLSAQSLDIDGTLYMDTNELTVSNKFDSTDGIVRSNGLVVLSSPGIIDIGSSTLSGLTLNDGLVGYWKMDTGTGLTAVDSSGYESDGTLTNMDASTDWVSGSSNINFANTSALNFDGSNDYINLGNPTALHVTGNQTISFWARPTALNARRNPICKAYGGVFCITQETSGTMNYYYGTSGANGAPYQGFGFASAVTAGEWSHVTFVRDFTNSIIRTYRDGTAGATAATTYTAATAGANSAYIGEGYVSSYYGDMDDVRLYNRALSATEVTSLAGGSLRSSTDTYTLGSALSISGDLTIGPTANLFLNSQNISISGDYDNNGTLQLTGDESSISLTMDYDSGETKYAGASSYSTLPAGCSYYNLLFEGEGTFNPNCTLLTASGTLTVSGASINLSYIDTSIDGDLINSGSIILTNTETASYGGISNTGSVTYTGTGTYTTFSLGDAYTTLNLTGSGGDFTLPSDTFVTDTLSLSVNVSINLDSYALSATSSIITNLGTITESGGAVIHNPSELIITDYAYSELSSFPANFDAYISLDEDDANLDGTAQDTIAVTLSTASDSETITLTETDVSSTVFRGSILGRDYRGMSASPPTEDGVLWIKDGETITVTFTDSQDGIVTTDTVGVTTADNLDITFAASTNGGGGRGGSSGRISGGDSRKSNPYLKVKSKQSSDSNNLESKDITSENNIKNYEDTSSVTESALSNITWSDFSPSHQNAQAASVLHSEGILKGHDDNTIRLDETLTRAEAIMLLHRTRKEEDNPTVSLPFHDISHEEWYAPALRESFAAGLISGHPDGSFRPGEQLNLVQSLKIITISLGLALQEDQESTKNWFDAYIDAGKQNNLVDGDLVFDRKVTRGEFVEWLVKVLGSSAVVD